MTQLPAEARVLLAELVNRIDAGKIRAGHPETYPRYGQIHDALGLKMRGETVGQSLKHQGLSALAEWTLKEDHPAVTGLIVSNETMMPGPGYFDLFRRNEDDFVWWKGQIEQSLSYDWRRFLAEAEPQATPIASDFDAPPPERVAAQVYRILRDTPLARRVKVLHEHRCQICGYSIRLPGGAPYAEAHHIQPLGNPHSEPDVMGNILCVCPNHHAELDYAAITIDLSQLRRAEGHQIDEGFVQYHNRRTMSAGQRPPSEPSY